MARRKNKNKERNKARYQGRYKEIQSVNWEALEHDYSDKGPDWFWILGIVTISCALSAFFFDNYLFALLILIGGGVLGLVASKEPPILHFAVTTRGIRVGPRLFPYSNLECYYLDEEHHRGPQLMVRSNEFLMPLIVMPVPEKYLEEISEILEARLPEEKLEEPISDKLLEFFGF